VGDNDTQNMRVSASVSINRGCTLVGVGDEIYLHGTILIYGFNYLLPGDKYNFRKSLGGKFPEICHRTCSRQGNPSEEPVPG
jgi:hypothetical protein